MRTSLIFTSLIASALLVACSSRDQSISESITEQFDSGRSTIDLSLVGPASWNRVCVIGPYATDESAERVLGIKWDVHRHSSIGASDTIYLLVFIRDDKVVAFTEHPRNAGDFVNLSPRCLERDKAKLVRKVRESGWVDLVRE